MTYIKKLILSIFLFILSFSIYAIYPAIIFHAAIQHGFINGQFVCTEVNEFGSLDYACGGKENDGSIRGIPAKTLPNNFFNPYHDPTKLKIIRVFIQSFQGEIHNNGEKIISCQFPYDNLTDQTSACISVDNNGTCKVSRFCC